MQTLFFADLPAFARFCARAAIIEKIADFAGREGTAGFLARAMRYKIGKPELLPPPLAPSTQAERVHLGFSADETLKRTGELEESIGFDHPSLRKTIVGSTDPKAVYHELGGSTAGRPPQRSFIASTVAEKHDEAFALYVKIFGVSFKPR